MNRSSSFYGEKYFEKLRKEGYSKKPASKDSTRSLYDQEPDVMVLPLDPTISKCDLIRYAEQINAVYNDFRSVNAKSSHDYTQVISNYVKRIRYTILKFKELHNFSYQDNPIAKKIAFPRYGASKYSHPLSQNTENRHLNPGNPGVEEAEDDMNQRYEATIVDDEEEKLFEAMSVKDAQEELSSEEEEQNQILQSRPISNLLPKLEENYKEAQQNHQEAQSSQCRNQSEQKTLCFQIQRQAQVKHQALDQVSQEYEQKSSKINFCNKCPFYINEFQHNFQMFELKIKKQAPYWDKLNGCQKLARYKKYFYLNLDALMHQLKHKCYFSKEVKVERRRKKRKRLPRK